MIFKFAEDVSCVVVVCGLVIVSCLCADLPCVWSEEIIFHLIVVRQLVREQ